MSDKKLPVQISTELVEIIFEVHEVFEDIDKVVAWLNTKNNNFGGIAPVQLINRDRGHKVLNFIRNAKEGNQP